MIDSSNLGRLLRLAVGCNFNPGWRLVSLVTS
jgi:hypothetical protein